MGGILDGVSEDVAHTLYEPGHIPFDVKWLVARGGLNGERMSPLAQSRYNRLDTLSHNRCEIDRPELQGNAPLRDARDIEQVVDEMRQPVDLALHDADGLRREPIVRGQPRQHFGRIADRV